MNTKGPIINMGGTYYNTSKDASCQNDSCQHYLQTGERKNLKNENVHEFVRMTAEFNEYNHVYENQTHNIVLCQTCWNRFYAKGLEALQPVEHIEKDPALEYAVAWRDDFNPDELSDDEKKALSKDFLDTLRETYQRKNA